MRSAPPPQGPRPALQDGDEVTLRCVYDNSDANPYATGESVHWGDATNDEMCLVYALAALGG